MDSDRIHRAVSPDGTEIVGRAHGQGPPVVMVPGGPGDGESSFALLVPGLEDHFTCHCMSTRGKGLSGGADDHSQPRLVEDVVAFVEAIGEPVALFGHSSGGMLVVEAAAQSDAVAALAVYEPADFAHMTEDQEPAITESVAAIARAVAEDRMLEASRLFYEGIALANDEELSSLSAGGVFELVAPNVPVALSQIEQSGLPQLSDPAVPDDITVPALVVTGDRTHPFYATAAREFARRLPEGAVAEVAGAGHLGPQLAPEPVAQELARFLTSTSPR